MAIDSAALTASLRRLAERGTDSSDVVSALTDVVNACVDLFGVTGSGIMLADEQNVARYVTASDGPGRVMETAESETGQGPCTEAFVDNRSVGITDVTAESRWPDLAAAVAPFGVRAVLGVPVQLGAVTVGTLDVYRDHPHEWHESEHVALARYSKVVGATLTTALAAHAAGELANQLQYALDYRVAIERGIGFLMARDGIDGVTAFNRLRRSARNSRRKIGEISEYLLAQGQLPDPPRP